MKIIGFIPSRLNSQRVPKKNIKLLGGIPLANYAIKTLNQVPAVDESVVFASEPSICEHIQKDLRYRFLKRPEYLDTPEAKVQDFIKEFLKREKADIIVLLHITSPFIKPETISECIEKIVCGKHDSAFAAVRLKKFVWYQGKPLNYRLDKPVPRTQDLEPLLIEQSGLYVFKRNLFEKYGRRISKNPYIKIIDSFEGHDIDSAEDFQLAELILKVKAVKGG